MPGPVMLAVVAAFAVSEARRDALTHYGLGLWRARNDLPVQAARQFEAAARADPTSPAPLRPLVTAYAEIGRDAAAIRTARKVLELDPGDADTAHTLGRLYYEAKRYADAAAVLKQAADSPRVATDALRRFGILRDLARACEAGADWPGAESALRAALAVAAEHRPALLRAPAYAEPGDLDRAVAAVHERLGQALLERKQYAGAEAAFAEAARQFTAATDRAAAARVDWNRSGVLAAQGKVDEALACLRRFLALKPSGPAPYERLANLLHRLHRGDEVVPALSRLADDHPTNPSIRWVLAIERGRTNLAASDAMLRDLADATTDPAFFRMLVRHYRTANRPAPLLNLADRLYRAARPPEKSDAEPDAARLRATERAQALTAAIRTDPGVAAMLVRQAADDARQGVERSADVWTLAAALAEQAGQLDAIEPALRSAVRDGQEEAFLPLFQMLSRQRRWEDLLSVIDLADAVQKGGGRRPMKGPGLRTVRIYDYYRATPLAELGRETALEALDKAKELVADPFGAQLERARILNILDRFADSAALGEQLLKQATEPAQVRRVRFVLAEAFLGMRQPAKAEDELRAVLEEDPDDELALNNLGYNLADQGRNLPEAEAMIRRAIEVDRDERARTGVPYPESGTYLDSLGWVLFRRGKLPEARDALEKAARSIDAAFDPIVWDHLGDVRFRLGERDGARAAWTKAAELYENSHQGRQFGRLDEVRRKLKQTE